MRAAELFAGYGGLAMAVEEVFGASHAWFSEFDAAPSKILAHHWPDVPNHGDVTKIDFAQVEQVDIISGGSPCQDLSAAGKRQGMTDGTRSNLWVQMRESIATIRPKYVVWENVRGAYSAGAYSEMELTEGRVGEDGNPNLRAIGRVLGDLSDLGFDAEWRGLRAADVGAPHGRYRVFVLATHPDRNGGERRGGNGDMVGAQGEGETVLSKRERDGNAADNSSAIGSPTKWGEHESAVRRWENLTGRPAPYPVGPGRGGKPGLSPRLTEWMMGVPDGWICDVPGVSRNEALKAAGNGVVPQQAIAALRDMLHTSHSHEGTAA